MFGSEAYAGYTGYLEVKTMYDKFIKPAPTAQL